jgi:membrane protease YdiL (CAAX protease family)
MSAVHAVACVAVLGWVGLVGLWLRRSPAVLVGGLVAGGVATLAGLATGVVRPAELGLGAPRSWPATLAAGAVGAAVLIAYSPVADAVARRWFPQRPDLSAFAAVRRSPLHLAAGIVVAWVLGGFLEEIAFRGVVLRTLADRLAPPLPGSVAAALAVVVAAAGAAVVHLYQGPRAAVTVGQLSAGLGVLFVLSGNNLWTVILSHGLYDTVAFVRFARGTSRYARAG